MVHNGIRVVGEIVIERQRAMRLEISQNFSWATALPERAEFWPRPPPKISARKHAFPNAKEIKQTSRKIIWSSI
jgi:hypothetical protein